MSAAAILLSLTQTGLKKKRRRSGTPFPRHAVGPRCGGSDRRAAPRPIRAWKLGGPAGPGSRGAGAPPTRGWPFRRGLPHACTLRDAPARGSPGGRERGRKRGAGGRCPPRETKALARARPTGCGAPARPFLPRGGSLGSGGWGQPGGRAPDQGARIAFAAAPLFSPDKFLRNWGVRLSSPSLLVPPLKDSGF